MSSTRTTSARTDRLGSSDCRTRPRLSASADECRIDPDRIPGEGRPGAAESPVVAGFRGGRAGSQVPGRRAWMRFAISPAAPAATSSSARPPRISSGVGIEDGSSALTVPASPSLPWLPPPVVGGRAGAARAACRSRCRSRPPLALGGTGVLSLTGLCRLLLLGDRRLQRAQDVVVGARVRLHVGRQVLERVLVAVHRIGLVDPAVVPVVQEQLPARCRCLGGRRADGRGAEGERDEPQRERELRQVAPER